MARRPSPLGNRHPAFTLVELMIVVSIMLIVSGILAGNYQIAVTRARVARVQSELREIEGALAAYHSDHGRIARMTHSRFYADSKMDFYEDIGLRGTLSTVLSTPVAYLSDAYRVDPFMYMDKVAPLDEIFYTYQEMDVYVMKEPTSKFWPAAKTYYGAWRLASVGPDQKFGHGFANSSQLPYDVSNGTISNGNIWRSQNNPVAMPDIPTLLGKH